MEITGKSFLDILGSIYKTKMHLLLFQSVKSCLSLDHVASTLSREAVGEGNVPSPMALLEQNITLGLFHLQTPPDLRQVLRGSAGFMGLAEIVETGPTVAFLM